MLFVCCKCVHLCAINELIFACIANVSNMYLSIDRSYMCLTKLNIQLNIQNVSTHAHSCIEKKI